MRGFLVPRDIHERGDCCWYFALYAVTGIGVFAGRNWLKTWIERGVQHQALRRGSKNCAPNFAKSEGDIQKASCEPKKVKSLPCGMGFSAVARNGRLS